MRQVQATLSFVVQRISGRVVCLRENVTLQPNLSPLSMLNEVSVKLQLPNDVLVHVNIDVYQEILGDDLDRMRRFL